MLIEGISRSLWRRVKNVGYFQIEYCDVKSAPMTLIQRRNNVVYERLFVPNAGGT